MNPDAFDSYPEMLNAEQLAKIPADLLAQPNAYQLLNCDSFPTLHIGKRKIAPKSKVLEWIDQMTSH